MIESVMNFLRGLRVIIRFLFHPIFFVVVTWPFCFAYIALIVYDSLICYKDFDVPVCDPMIYLTDKTENEEWYETANRKLNDWHIAILTCVLLITLTYNMALTWRKRHHYEHNDYFVAEKMVNGSVFLREEPAPFQAKVFGVWGNDTIRIGQCFRINDKLVTAKHVIEGYNEIVIRLGIGLRFHCNPIPRR